MPEISFLQNEYFGNAVSAYLLAAATFFGVLWGLLLARLTATHLDDLTVAMLEKVRAPECYLVALYLPGDTAPSILKKVPGHGRSAVGKAKDARLERSHMSGVKDGALEFELAFYVRGTDYNAFMDAQETVQLDMSLRAEGVAITGPAMRVTPAPAAH